MPLKAQVLFKQNRSNYKLWLRIPIGLGVDENFQFGGYILIM
jgi:hypothetical protein